MTICNIKLSDKYKNKKNKKMLTGFVKIGFCCPLIQSLIFYTLYFCGYIISLKYLPVKLFLVAEVLRYFKDIFNYLFKIWFINFLILFLLENHFYPQLGFFVGKFHRTDHQLKH